MLTMRDSYLLAMTISSFVIKFILPPFYPQYREPNESLLQPSGLNYQQMMHDKGPDKLCNKTAIIKRSCFWSRPRKSSDSCRFRIDQSRVDSFYFYQREQIRLESFVFIAANVKKLNLVDSKSFMILFGGPVPILQIILDSQSPTRLVSQ